MALFSVCATNSGVPSAIDLTDYAHDQDQCIRENDAEAASNACRADKAAAFCKRFPNSRICLEGGAP